MRTDERIERARVLCEQASFYGDAAALAVAEAELDAVEADLALARGRILHARFLDSGVEDPAELALFERASELYRAHGDVRGEAESLFWVGTFHQVVRRDHDAGVPVLRRSHELATRAGDELTMSYALRHLGIAAHVAGELADARDLLEESTRLRRELGFLPGVAANLVGLAYIAAAEDRRDDATRMLDEAAEIADAGGARTVRRWVDEARETVEG
ncbi:MAG: tetratricopeptide repeat protein [Streptomycetaceae bacterium]|nr:tetratricopeptide repeat protein [Streptomycetaceae bacterium]